MSKNKKAKVESLKPNGFCWFVYTTVSKAMCFFKGFKINRTELKKQIKRSKETKKGFLIVYNHAGTKDHFLLTAGLNYFKTNYVLAKVFYFNPLIKLVTTWVKAIFKDQFTPDLQAIRKIKKAIDRPGAVAIAPAGQMSVDGGEQFISFGIVKLIRLCKCDVLGYKIYGLHYHYPKWGKNKRKSKISAEFVPVIKAEELATLTDQEIFDRIYSVCSFDMANYQKEHMNIIKGKKLAEGIEGMLYVCPKCGKYHQNYSEDNKLICKACGNTVIYDKYGFLNPTEYSVGFKIESEWNTYQRELIKKNIKENDDFKFEGIFDLYRDFNTPKKVEFYSRGKVILTKERFYFEGEFNGEPYLKEFPLKQIFLIPYGTNVSFNVPNEEGQFKFFAVDNPTEIYEVVQTIDALREIEEENGKVF